MDYLNLLALSLPCCFRLFFFVSIFNANLQTLSHLIFFYGIDTSCWLKLLQLNANQIWYILYGVWCVLVWVVFLVAQNYRLRHTLNAAMLRISSRYCNSSPLLLIPDQKSCISTFAKSLKELWPFENVLWAYQQVSTKTNI